MISPNPGRYGSVAAGRRLQRTAARQDRPHRQHERRHGHRSLAIFIFPGLAPAPEVRPPSSFIRWSRTSWRPRRRLIRLLLGQRPSGLRHTDAAGLVQVELEVMPLLLKRPQTDPRGRILVADEVIAWYAREASRPDVASDDFWLRAGFFAIWKPFRHFLTRYSWSSSSGRPFTRSHDSTQPRVLGNIQRPPGQSLHYESPRARPQSRTADILVTIRRPEGTALRFRRRAPRSPAAFGRARPAAGGRVPRPSVRLPGR